MSTRPQQDSSATSSAPVSDRGLGASIALPKGGGAIRGIGEKFAANPVSGTGTLTLPIATSPGRAGFAPTLTLTYDSGAGNGPFGLGWTLALPSITRRTDKGLPRYEDREESDVFILSGSEDLVPATVESTPGHWVRDSATRSGYRVTRYRPRIEGLFSRIERWTRISDGDTHWRSIARDNVTTFYGKTAQSRIADPEDPTRVFSWLICESSDDKGNSIVYDYVAEDSSTVDLSMAGERNRSNLSRSANRYLARIRYGNQPSRLVEPDITKLSWLFEVAFDYGEGRYAAQAPDAQGRVFVAASMAGNRPWPARQDPFSRYRAGFEVRTYRLCRSVLVFHHFPAELGTPDCLVQATRFAYEESPLASFIAGATQSGYVRQADGRYLERSMPTALFDYSRAEVQHEVREVDAQSLANLPASVDGRQLRWLDLDGEGTQGVLLEHDNGWYYKRNLSPLSFESGGANPTASARFETLTRVAQLPGFARGGAPHRFIDLAGDGQLDCVVLEHPGAGFYERTQDESWDVFQPLASALDIDWGDPELRLLDLTGDGHADVLITENDVFNWHPSLGKEGFAAAQRVAKALDEDQGPTVVFADASQSVFLADMCGDGLTDIVRIRNGEVCYWPNLGYGRFGRKVAMNGVSGFASQDQFDPRRIRLADIDGSGTADLLYVAADGVQLYFNQSGNSWRPAEIVRSLPRLDELSSIEALDLLGNGTACLVWSSSRPNDAGRSMRYVDLMGGQKPHLLIRSRNGLGAESRISYAPSTKYYLADRQGGQPWATRLPFPVHVVERVETDDRVGRNRFVTRYAYHHGHYDGIEREFRGFGMVEQQDTEVFGALTPSGDFPDAVNVEAASHVPPMLTKTWFHTGAYPNAQSISGLFAQAYYRESDLSQGLPGLGDAAFKAMQLPDTVLPAGLTGSEFHEAIRALKGTLLRQEVYALDGTDEADRPYSVREQNHTVERLQPLGENRHAVFFAHARETIDFHYERALYDVSGSRLADPRVTHEMVLAVDDFGNVLQSASIAYGRRHDDPDPLLRAEDRAEQKKTHVTCTENTFTVPIVAPDAFRTPLPAETRTYEIVHVTPLASLPGITNRFGFSEMAGRIAQAADGLHDLSYQDIDAAGVTNSDPWRRLIEQSRTLYRKDDLSGGLPLGGLESLALPFESYKLALTPGLLAQFHRDAVNLLPNLVAMLRNQGGYAAGDDNKAAGLFPAADAGGLWWIPSGRLFFSPDPVDTAAQEQAAARTHFYRLRRSRDTFGNDATARYDAHDLLTVQTEDALHNLVSVENDYRVLKPVLVTDANGNRSQAAFDALGFVVGTAVMGKTSEALGDSLAGFVADPTRAEVDAFFATPKGPAAATLLQSASSCIVYDVNRFERQPALAPPSFAATIARETHVADLAPGQASVLQVSFGYSDGFGREVQRKLQAEAGPLVPAGPDVDPRWIGSGWTIYNNKGKPVRQYEPFFDATHDFRFGAAIGVSPIVFYDPAGRAVATLHPDHTWNKVVFDPWRVRTYDASDTVLVADPAADADVGDLFARLPAADYLPTWFAQRQSGALGPQQQDAARKSAVHSDTPGAAYADSLGRSFLTLAHNAFRYGDTPPGDTRVEAFHRTRVVFDIEGNRRAIVDARDRRIVQSEYDMLGRRIREASMDAGTRWMLDDVAGKPLYAWDSSGHRRRTACDALRRPNGTFLLAGAAPEVQTGRIDYGEAEPSPETENLRGRPVRVFDQAGVVFNDRYDFKGNLRRSRRQLAQDYKATLDWSGPVALEADLYTSEIRHDALDRPVEVTAPDDSRIRPAYNEANLLERLDVNLQGALQAGAPVWTAFVTNIDYDAKGRRVLIAGGNGAVTTSAYDPLSMRLTRLRTQRNAAAFPGDCPQPPPASWPGCQVQDLVYVYDAAGNVTSLRDDAQQAIYFRNKRVVPSADYRYDALFRLIESTGREHLGQAGGTPTPGSYNDAPRVGISFSANDGNAMGRYLQRYVYDAVGNFLQMIHRGTDPAQPGWTRSYAYSEASLLEPGKQGNRLTSTVIGAATETYSTGGNGYDAHGNLLRMPHLQTMQWDFADHLQMTQRQAVNAGDDDGLAHQGERTWYVYDAAGQRVRKVTELAGGTVKNERIYLSGFEIYRRHGANPLVRETLHVMDDKQRIAIVETLAQGSDGSPPQLIRYQVANHLRSSVLELDERAQIISYEEFYPYGNTSFQAVDKSIKAAAKRYRYAAQEHDEENGFYYQGARYYAAWLGRWTAADPIGIADGPNLYAYVSGNPVTLSDPRGTDGTVSTDDKGTPVYQASGDQVGKDAGKIAKEGWKAVKDSPEVKGVEKLVLDPLLSQLKTGLANDLKTNKAGLITGGALVILPSVGLLTALTVSDKKLDVPIVGELHTREIGFAALSAGLGAGSSKLFDDKAKIDVSYERKDGKERFGYQQSMPFLTDKLKLSVDSRFGEKYEKLGLGLDYTLRSDTKISASGSGETDAGKTTVTGKIELKFPVAGVPFRLGATGTYKTTPEAGTPPFTANAEVLVEPKIQGTRFQFGLQAFAGATPPKDGLFLPKPGLDIVPTGPLPLYTPTGNGFFLSLTIPTGAAPAKR